MSNLLACILVCNFSVRDKHDEGIKEMCSTGLSNGRSKLLQSCSNFALIACLAGRDTQEVLYTGYVQQCSTFRKKCWGQLAPKFSFLVARPSLLVAKN